MSTPYRIQCTDRLTAQEKRAWSELLQGEDFGEIAVDWSEAVMASKPKNIELHYLQLFSGAEPKALVILHILRKLDLSEYMGKVVGRILSGIGVLGWRPWKVDIAFIEIPMSNLCGIQFAKGAESESLAIAEQVCGFVREKFKYDILCLKASPNVPAESLFDQLGMLGTEFLANMSLPIKGFTNFDAYVRSLKKQARVNLRSNQRVFKDAGGVIELLEQPTQVDFERLAEKYQRTCEYHASLGEIAVPIPVKKEFFESIFSLPTRRRRVFYARLQGEIIGFGLAVDSGESIYFTHCGLDYSKTVPSRAYFNLYYALIEYAISRGYEYVELGAQAYDVKRRLGGKAFGTKYHFEVRSPLLSAIAGFVAKNFSSQKGSEISREKT